MKNTAITYWLIPSEPTRSFFENKIADLARRYDAPVFEPHMTIHLGLDRSDVVEEVITKAAICCGPIQARALAIHHSSEFTKTLFVQFALNQKMSCLNEIIRNVARNTAVTRDQLFGSSNRLEPRKAKISGSSPCSVARIGE